MLTGFIFALLSPMFFAAANTVDKFYLAHRIKNSLSFLAIAGIISILSGIILSAFLNWQNASVKMLIFPAVSGIIMSLEMYAYFIVLKKEDVSTSINIIYTYPLLLAFMSFVVLGETLSRIGYLGVGLIMLGIISLSITKKITSRNILAVILLIIFVASNELFVKLSTNNLPVVNGIAVNLVFAGLIPVFSIIRKKIRKDLKPEMKNLVWIFFAEGTDKIGMIFLFLAAAYLPITIVASIASIQPLIVILFEYITDKHFAKIIKDRAIAKKLISAALVVSGVIVLYSAGLK